MITFFPKYLERRSAIASSWRSRSGHGYCAGLMIPFTFLLLTVGLQGGSLPGFGTIINGDAYGVDVDGVVYYWLMLVYKLVYLMKLLCPEFQRRLRRRSKSARF